MKYHQDLIAFLLAVPSSTKSLPMECSPQTLLTCITQSTCARKLPKHHLMFRTLKLRRQSRSTRHLICNCCCQSSFRTLKLSWLYFFPSLERGVGAYELPVLLPSLLRGPMPTRPCCLDAGSSTTGLWMQRSAGADSGGQVARRDEQG